MLSICFIFIPIVFALPRNESFVEIKNGVLRGSIHKSRSGRLYEAYRGIPYAQPPVGPLRFKAPQPPNDWNGIRNVTKDGPYCLQKNYIQYKNPQVEGAEDCLYLNVYVPKTTTHALLPVLVFIHWGALLIGRGNSDILGPNLLMEKDLILVTFNYRLGVLGFMSTLDDNAPGNFGFKDQVAALEWVQKNIAAFGGDPNSVTLSGQSAGSGSTHLHMVSPQSRGLFHKVISMSGSGLDIWARPLNDLQYQATQVQASFFGCGNRSNAELVECMRGVDARELTDSFTKFLYFGSNPLLVFTSVMEKKTESNPRPFLEKLPQDYILEGNFANVPWIVGSAQGEGILRASYTLRNPEIVEKLNASFNELMPKILLLDMSDKNNGNLWNGVKNFYFKGKDYNDLNDPEYIQGFIDVLGDRIFTYGIYQAAVAHALQNHTSIWVYNFNYKGKYSYGELFALNEHDINFEWGVSHCDDLLYIFDSPALFPMSNSFVDLAMSHYMLNLWSNFITFGNPDPESYWVWNTMNLKGFDFDFLNIDGTSGKSEITVGMQSGYWTDRMSFWRNSDMLENFF